MTTVLRSVDLSPIQAAIEAADAATVERIARELGLELSYQALIEYVHRFEKRSSGVYGREAFRLFYAALHDPIGYAAEAQFGLTMLVVRHGRELVFGLQHAGSSRQMFPKGGWKISRWFKDPAKNWATIEGWAADPERAGDSIRFPITRVPETTGSDPRGDDLLAAVTADPDDDGARLVYADWLAEHGDARGELIRVQCELAAGGQLPEKRTMLDNRETELLSSLQPAFEAAVGHFTEHFRIERGLVEAVTIFVVKLAKYGPELVRQHPIKRLRILCNGAQEFARLATLPVFARVPEIEIESRKTPRIIHSRAVMKPTAVPALFATTKRLELADVDDKAAEWAHWLTVVQAPVLEELRLLRLDLDLPTYELFANAEVLPALRCLEIAFPRFAQTVTRDRDRLIEAVWTIGQRRALEEYRFTSWHIDDVVLGRCVRDMLRCKTLTRLVIDNCGKVDRATAEALSTGGERLVHLQLDDLDGSLTAGVIAALPNLESLSCDVKGDRGHGPVIDAIEASSSIRRLCWRGTPLTDHQRARLDHLELR